MRKGLVLIIVILLATSPMYSQKPCGKHKLLYHVTSEDDFYIGEIHEILENLYCAGSESKIYEDVKSFNDQLAGKVSETTLADYARYVNGAANTLDKARTALIREIGCELLNFDRLLQIKIKAMPNSEKISFAFRMWDVEHAGEINCQNAGLATLPKPTGKPKLWTVVLDPSTDAEFRAQLIYAVKKVNPETNKRPSIQFKVAGRSVNATTFVSIRDSVRVEARAMDTDSRPQDLNVSWRQITPIQLQNLDADKPNQRMWFDNTGSFDFQAEASDQISRSGPAKLTLIAIKPPEIRYIGSPVDYFFRQRKAGQVSEVNVFYRTFPRSQVGVKARPYPLYPFEIGLDTVISAGSKLNFAFRSSMDENALAIDVAMVDQKKNLAFAEYVPESSDVQRSSHLLIEYLKIYEKDYEVRVRPNYSYLQPGSYLIETTAEFNGVKGTPKVFRLNMLELTKTTIFLMPYGVSFNSSNAGIGHIFTRGGQIMGKIEAGLTRRFSSKLEAAASVVYLFGDKFIAAPIIVNNRRLAYNLGFGMVLNSAKNSDSDFTAGMYYKWYILPAKLANPEVIAYTSHAIGVGAFFRVWRKAQINFDVYPRIGGNARFNGFNMVEIGTGANMSWIRKVRKSS